MIVSKEISNKISRIPTGKIFGYGTLKLESKDYAAAMKAISRLISAGKLHRIKPGLFYKPEQSIFGLLNPKESEIIKSFLFKENKRIAYITGLTLFNRMGLTTQVPNILQIASTKRRNPIKIGAMKLSFMKSYEIVKENNVKLLRLLDVIKDFNCIPDGNSSQILKFLLKNIEKLDEEEKKRIVTIALKYPPRVRALLGAILDKLWGNQYRNKLKDFLNPASTYIFDLKKQDLPNIVNWNIR